MQSIHCVRNTAPSKFDETFEVVANLNIDPKKTNVIVRGMLSVTAICVFYRFSFLTDRESTLAFVSLPMESTLPMPRMPVRT